MDRRFILLAALLAFPTAVKAFDCDRPAVATISFEDLRGELERFSHQEGTLIGKDPPNLSYQDLRTVLGAADATNLLSGMALSGLNFTCADLRGLDLRGTRLFESVLNGARLDGAKLAGARMTRAHLIGASLVAVEMDKDTTLIGVDLSGADLTGAVMTGVDATGVDLSNAVLVATKVEGLRLTNASLTGAVWQTQGEVSADAVANLSGLESLTVQLCADPPEELDNTRCTHLVGRPDLAGLVLLRRALIEGGDEEGQRLVRHAIGSVQTDLAWAKAQVGGIALWAPAVLRWTLHELFIDHGLARARAFLIIVSLLGVFAGIYVALEAQLGPAKPQLIWLLPPGQLKKDKFGKFYRTDEEERKRIDRTFIGIIAAASIYSLLAAIRIGFERLSIVGALAKVLPFPWLVEGVDKARWIGAVQTVLFFFLIATLVQYLLP